MRNLALFVSSNTRGLAHTWFYSVHRGDHKLRVATSVSWYNIHEPTAIVVFPRNGFEKNAAINTNDINALVTKKKENQSKKRLLRSKTS